MRTLLRLLLASVAALAIVPAGTSLGATAADGGAGTYTGTAPTFDFVLSNSGTTAWVYVVLVPPDGVNFTGGQTTGAPCVVGNFAARAGELECGPFAPGVAPNAQLAVRGTVDASAARMLAAYPCGSKLRLFVSSTGMLPYVQLGDIVFAGTCAPAMPPATPPPPPALATLTTEVQGGGKVTSEPDGTIGCPPTCKGTYPKGSKVGLRATPDDGWEFDHWEVDCKGPVKTCTVTLDTDRKVVAVFRRTRCECVTIDTRARGAAFGAAVGDPSLAEISFTVDWDMICLGREGTCRGEIDVQTPAGTDLVLSEPNPVTVGCDGTCGRRGGGLASGSFTVRATSRTSLAADARIGKEFVFSFALYCIVDGKRIAVGDGTVTFAFDGNGQVDVKKSDLDGNEVRDGDDPPPPAACRCTGIAARLKVTNSFSDTVLAFDIDWRLTCAGRSGGCKGEIQPLGAITVDVDTGQSVDSEVALSVVRFRRAKRPVLTCTGRCDREPAKGTIGAVARSPRDLKPRARAGTILKIVLRTRCADGKWSVVAYDLAFDRKGRFAPNSPATKLAGTVIFKEP